MLRFEFDQNPIGTGNVITVQVPVLQPTPITVEVTTYLPALSTEPPKEGDSPPVLVTMTSTKRMTGNLRVTLSSDDVSFDLDADAEYPNYPEDVAEPVTSVSSRIVSLNGMTFLPAHKMTLKVYVRGIPSEDLMLQLRFDEDPVGSGTTLTKRVYIVSPAPIASEVMEYLSFDNTEASPVRVALISAERRVGTLRVTLPVGGLTFETDSNKIEAVYDPSYLVDAANPTATVAKKVATFTGLTLIPDTPLSITVHVEGLPDKREFFSFEFDENPVGTGPVLTTVSGSIVADPMNVEVSRHLPVDNSGASPVRVTLRSTEHRVGSLRVFLSAPNLYFDITSHAKADYSSSDYPPEKFDSPIGKVTERAVVFTGVTLLPKVPLSIALNVAGRPIVGNTETLRFEFDEGPVGAGPVITVEVPVVRPGPMDVYVTTYLPALSAEASEEGDSPPVLVSLTSPKRMTGNLRVTLSSDEVSFDTKGAHAEYSNYPEDVVQPEASLTSSLVSIDGMTFLPAHKMTLKVYIRGTPSKELMLQFKFDEDPTGSSTTSTKNVYIVSPDPIASQVISYLPSDNSGASPVRVELISSGRRVGTLRVFLPKDDGLEFENDSEKVEAKYDSSYPDDVARPTITVDAKVATFTGLTFLPGATVTITVHVEGRPGKRESFRFEFDENPVGTGPLLILSDSILAPDPIAAEVTRHLPVDNSEASPVSVILRSERQRTGTLRVTLSVGTLSFDADSGDSVSVAHGAYPAGLREPSWTATERFVTFKGLTFLPNDPVTVSVMIAGTPVRGDAEMLRFHFDENPIGTGPLITLQIPLLQPGPISADVIAYLPPADKSGHSFPVSIAMRSTKQMTGNLRVTLSSDSVYFDGEGANARYVGYPGDDAKPAPVVANHLVTITGMTFLPDHEVSLAVHVKGTPYKGLKLNLEFDEQPTGTALGTHKTNVLIYPYNTPVEPLSATPLTRTLEEGQSISFTVSSEHEEKGTLSVEVLNADYEFDVGKHAFFDSTESTLRHPRKISFKDVTISSTGHNVIIYIIIGKSLVPCDLLVTLHKKNGNIAQKIVRMNPETSNSIEALIPKTHDVTRLRDNKVLMTVDLLKLGAKRTGPLNVTLLGGNFMFEENGATGLSDQSIKPSSQSEHTITFAEATIGGEPTPFTFAMTLPDDGTLRARIQFNLLDGDITVQGTYASPTKDELVPPPRLPLFALKVASDYEPEMGVPSVARLLLTSRNILSGDVVLTLGNGWTYSDQYPFFLGRTAYPHKVNQDLTKIEFQVNFGPGELEIGVPVLAPSEDSVGGEFTLELTEDWGRQKLSRKVESAVPVPTGSMALQFQVEGVSVLETAPAAPSCVGSIVRYWITFDAVARYFADKSFVSEQVPRIYKELLFAPAACKEALSVFDFDEGLTPLEGGDVPHMYMRFNTHHPNFEASLPRGTSLKAAGHLRFSFPGDIVRAKSSQPLACDYSALEDAVSQYKVSHGGKNASSLSLVASQQKVEMGLSFVTVSAPTYPRELRGPSTVLVSIVQQIVAPHDIPGTDYKAPETAPDAALRLEFHLKGTIEHPLKGACEAMTEVIVEANAAMDGARAYSASSGKIRIGDIPTNATGMRECDRVEKEQTMHYGEFAFTGQLQTFNYENVHGPPDWALKLRLTTTEFKRTGAPLKIRFDGHAAGLPTLCPNPMFPTNGDLSPINRPNRLPHQDPYLIPTAGMILNNYETGFCASPADKPDQAPESNAQYLCDPMHYAPPDTRDGNPDRRPSIEGNLVRRSDDGCNGTVVYVRAFADQARTTPGEHNLKDWSFNIAGEARVLYAPLGCVIAADPRNTKLLGSIRMTPTDPVAFKGTLVIYQIEPSKTILTVQFDAHSDVKVNLDETTTTPNPSSDTPMRDTRRSKRVAFRTPTVITTPAPIEEDLPELDDAAVGDSAADDDDGGCFPASAEIRVEGGNTKRIDQVKEGEKVLVLTHNKQLQYQKLITFSHKLSSGSLSSIIQIAYKTRDGVEGFVKSSPAHLIGVKKRGDILFDTPAANVVVGDAVAIANEKTMSPDFATVTDVTALDGKYAGVFAPHTLAGTIVVNGVIASCYVDVSIALGKSGESKFLSTFTHDAQHQALSPFLRLHSVIPSILTKIDTDHKHSDNILPRLAHHLEQAVAHKLNALLHIFNIKTDGTLMITNIFQLIFLTESKAL